MTEQPRNWDKELADIDRVIAEQGRGTAGQQGGAVAPRSGTPAPAAGGVAPGRRGSVAVTWFWVLLAVGLALALPLWPYQRTCGMQAVFFLGGTGITALVGGLAALSSWANRRGFAHILSLLVIAWAGAVAASEILPRVGYARETKTWTCPAVPAGAPAPAPTQPGDQPAPIQQTPAPATAAPDAGPATP